MILRSIHKYVTELVEVEPSPDEYNELIDSWWRDWYEDEREAALTDIAEYANRRFKIIEHKREFVTRMTGKRPLIRIPRKTIRIPDEVYARLEL